MPRHRIHRATLGTSGSTVHLPPRARIIFQRYPGTGGPDSARVIGNVPFEATYSGHRPPSRGNTNADGSIEIYVWPHGETHLRIFDTEFQLVPHDVSGGDTAIDVFDRLLMLGYVDASVNSYLIPACEALSMFQEDREIEPTGTPGDESNRLLRETYGF